MHEYRRILALVDFDPLGARVAHRAAALARLGNAELALLHWIEPDTQFDGGYPPPSPAEARRGYETAALRRMQFFAGGLDHANPELLAVYGPGRQTLLDRIEAWQPDLVVAGRDPGELGQRHDLLTLGQTRRGRGRLIRILRGLLPGAEGWLAWRS